MKGSRVSVGDEDAARGVEMKAVCSALDGHDPGGRDMRPVKTVQPATGNRLYTTPLYAQGDGLFSSATRVMEVDRSNHRALSRREIRPLWRQAYSHGTMGLNS